MMFVFVSVIQEFYFCPRKETTQLRRSLFKTAEVESATSACSQVSVAAAKRRTEKPPLRR